MLAGDVRVHHTTRNDKAQLSSEKLIKNVAVGLQKIQKRLNGFFFGNHPSTFFFELAFPL